MLVEKGQLQNKIISKQESMGKERREIEKYVHVISYK